ncbi:MAG: beta-hydroxyacyl-ACP dehydratase [Candidatus Cryptobacteroides sp.]
MLLENYYNIDGVVSRDGGAVFTVSLNPDCGVYAGHFPGSPVCPGVCSMQMVKECAEKAAGREYRIKEIKQCRYVSLMSPQTHPQVTVDVALEPTGEGTQVLLKASVLKGEELCLSLKAVLE